MSDQLDRYMAVWRKQWKTEGQYEAERRDWERRGEDCLSDIHAR